MDNSKEHSRKLDTHMDLSRSRSAQRISYLTKKMQEVLKEEDDSMLTEEEIEALRNHFKEVDRIAHEIWDSVD